MLKSFCCDDMAGNPCVRLRQDVELLVVEALTPKPLREHACLLAATPGLQTRWSKRGALNMVVDQNSSSQNNRISLHLFDQLPAACECIQHPLIEETCNVPEALDYTEYTIIQYIVIL